MLLEDAPLPTTLDIKSSSRLVSLTRTQWLIKGYCTRRTRERTEVVTLMDEDLPRA